MEQLHWVKECMCDKRKWFYLAMGLAILSSALCVVFPFITQQITDKVMIGQPQADGSVVHRLDLLPALLALLVVAQLLRSGVRYGMTSALEYVSQNVQQKIRTHLYSQLCVQDTNFYHKYRTGDLMTRLTGDLDMVRHTISWISFSVVESAFLFFFSMAYLFTVNVALTAMLLVLTPVILFCSFFFSKTVYPLYAALREKLSAMNSAAQENIAGNKTVRAFVREAYECEKFEACNEEYRSANLKANFYWLKFFPYIEGCSQALGIIILLAGGLFIINGRMTPGDLAAFSLLAWGLSEPMRSLGVYLNDFQRFLTSAAKIMEIYYVAPAVASPSNGAAHSLKPGCVEFCDVTYAYPGNVQKPALDKVNFCVQQGQTLAVLGATGSGKTTLIDAVTRMFDVTEGSVKVGGIDVRQWDLQALRRCIGVATQRVLLYSDTVAANVAYSNPELTEEQVETYAQLAAAQFCEQLPEQYGTIIGEQGTGLSGGQKQRIALARALAKQPDILILDDTTSAVDLETEMQLRQNLQCLPYPCTKIVVAQRISAVRSADCILVMDKGRIVQQGTHAQLIAQVGYYRDICRLQGVTGLPVIECEEVE